MTSIYFVYRSTAGDNGKARHSYFMKDLALESFARAVSHVQSTTTFLNDGPMPSPRLNRMHSLGKVRGLPGVGYSRSYRVALSMLDSHDWPDDEFVYFAGDQYPNMDNIFVVLRWAAASIKVADFFILYNHPDCETLPVHREYRPSRRLWSAGGHTWRPVRSTCMSFCARVGALRRAPWLHFLASRNDCRGDFDLWSVSQRAPGFRVLGSPVDPWSLADLEALKLAAKGLKGRATGLLVAPFPGPACQMQLPHVSDDRVWSAVAERACRAS